MISQISINKNRYIEDILFVIRRHMFTSHQTTDTKTPQTAFLSLPDQGGLLVSVWVVTRGCVSTGFLSVFVLASANWDPVGHASVWNERSRPAAGQSGEETCVFYRQKDKPSVSYTLIIL